MKENFETALHLTLEFEGGYSQDPLDPGGETNYGISKKSYPEEDIKNITPDRVREIYKKDYWDKSGCNGLASPLDIFVFDAAVNMGITQAVDIVTEAGGDACRYQLKRIGHYIEKCKRKPVLRSYLMGWNARVIRLFTLFG